jgi:4-aminobutyrate aminotransferase/(S)-3-amino-2-methylpropionate transaminase
VTGDGDRTPNPELVQRVAKACLGEGLLVLSAGTCANVLRFLPPLVIGDDLLNEALDLPDRAFAAA